MKRRLIRLLPVASLVATIFFAQAGIVYAVSYYLSIGVDSDPGTPDYAPLAVAVDINNENLADLGYITDSGLDTRIIYAGAEQKHMVAEEKLAFVAPEIKDGLDYSFNYTMGDEALDAFSIIPGYDGYVTISDDAALEFDDNFIFEIKGWVDTTSGSNKNLIFKSSAFKVYISGDGAISAAITGGASVTASGVTSGEHTVKVTADKTDLKIYIDGVEEDSSALGGTPVPDNSNDWTLMQNNCLAYVEYVKIWLD